MQRVTRATRAQISRAGRRLASAAIGGSFASALAALLLTNRAAAESLLADTVAVGSVLTGLVIAAITLVLTVQSGVVQAGGNTNWRPNAIGVNVAVQSGSASMALMLAAIGLKSWAAGNPTAPARAVVAASAFLLTANAIVVATAARDFLHLAVVKIHGSRDEGRPSR